MVKDVRPSEDELQWILDEIFVSTADGVSIPKELNQNILQFLTWKELLRFEMASKKAEMIAEHCHAHAFMYDAIHEQINDLLNELNIDRSRWWDQLNEHKFKVGNRVRVHGGGGDNGYCVRVTPKFVFFISKPDIFKHRPFICRVGDDEGVMHARPYYGGFDETVQSWRTWSSLMQEFLDSD
jgi:hypothetical protein